MRVSVLLRASSADEGSLRQTSASLAEQTHRDWEAIVAAASGLDGVGAQVRIVEASPGDDPGCAYERARLAATGDVVVILAPGDGLARDAFAVFVDALEALPAVDVVYADEDRVARNGAHHSPFLRPDWSPDYLLSALYIDRAFAVRRTALDRVGGFRSRYGPVPEWDLLLRLAEAGPFAHVPRVLFHRSGEPGTPWRPDDAAMIEAGRRAVADACQRRGVEAEVVPAAVPGTYRARRRLPSLRVSVIVPFRDGAVLLGRCLRSLLADRRPEVEIVLVDNGSVEADTRRLVDATARERAVRVVEAPGPFNFSVLVNRGAAAATGQILCLLNSDVEALAPKWLEALVEHAIRPDVGAVGARLVYPDGSVQHAGIAIANGTAEHVHLFAPREATGYFASLAVVREVSAVTGACLATRRDVFERAGGFDERLPAAYNDVDYCLRVREMGLRVLVTPEAELVHQESGSRSRVDHGDAALDYMRQRWGMRLAVDPYWRMPDSVPGAPTAWLARQVARLRWLATDLRDGLRASAETLAWAASRADDGPAVAFLAGSPVAVRGERNRYGVRLVNPSSMACEATVLISGFIPAEGREPVFEHATGITLLARSARALVCETDWRGRVTLTDDDAVIASSPRCGRGTPCRLVVALDSGRRPRQLVVEQSMIG